MTLADRDFINMVVYFWEQKGDPTRYAGWDDGRCQRLMPAFHQAWSQYATYEKLTNSAARDAYVGDED